jgi:Ser/Thr protein kinase RdoA (MazF antagonist)
MDREARAAFNETTRSEIFDWLGISASQVRDLDGFENFVFAVDNSIVRVTHKSHRDRHQLLGELEFIEYLAERGAPVASPVRLPDDRLLKSFEAFHVCRFQVAEGESLRDGLPDDDQVRAWGRGIGMFHRLATDFAPQYRRQDWQADENHQFRSRIPVEETTVLSAADGMMTSLAALPADEAVYGLIHSHAHPGNFLAEGSRLTFFDFDDCLYTWFGYDVATILLGVALDCWRQDQVAEEAVLEFLHTFLAGYEQEMPRASLMLEQMPLFLKLREFSLYAVIKAHMGDDHVEAGMPSVFMQDRKERLASGVPFLDLDFNQFS